MKFLYLSPIVINPKGARSAALVEFMRDNGLIPEGVPDAVQPFMPSDDTKTYCLVKVDIANHRPIIDDGRFAQLPKGFPRLIKLGTMQRQARLALTRHLDDFGLGTLDDDARSWGDVIDDICRDLQPNFDPQNATDFDIQD
jgi:hypothetical protein